MWYSALQGGLRSSRSASSAGRRRPGARRPWLAPDHPRARPHARERRGPRPGRRRALHRRHHDDPQRAHRRDRPEARAVHARPQQAMSSLARLGELDATWVLPGRASGTAARARPCGSHSTRRRGNAMSGCRSGSSERRTSPSAPQLSTPSSTCTSPGGGTPSSSSRSTCRCGLRTQQPCRRRLLQPGARLRRARCAAAGPVLSGSRWVRSLGCCGLSTRRRPGPRLRPEVHQQLPGHPPGQDWQTAVLEDLTP